ncbi:MAG: trypsin-like peptidase domain-containing protein [Bryobacteraceae bacterium]|nr:trypsin-like peptidase domain-containing protein [Bryobacteraceae bacterium]
MGAACRRAVYRRGNHASGSGVLMREMTVGLSVMLSALLVPAAGTADVDYRAVFMVEASRCVSLPELRTQTGFLLEGVPGLVTALHGVVGCGNISARQPDRNLPYPNLSIRSVDVERDVAVLAGPSLPPGPLLKPRPATVLAGSTVTVIGHPEAIPGTLDMELKVPSLSLRPLSFALPPGLMPAVQRRQSPSVDVKVLMVNGDLQPGHSGAPIVDSTGRVLGVASGGLGDGALGIGWAIPLNEIQWVAAGVRQSDLDRLAGNEPTLVFAYRDPDKALPPAVQRSAGSGCIQQASLFDLDRGDSRPGSAQADLFLQAKTNIERSLDPWGGAAMAVIGPRDFNRVTPESLARAPFTSQGICANRDERNLLPAGTVLAVRTNESRLAKVLVHESRGDYVSFEWITFALPSEGPSPVPPTVQPCGAEQGLLCGSGALQGDAIDSFRVLNRQDAELLVSVRFRHHVAHGQVWLGSYLLDQNGASLSGGYHPTAAVATAKPALEVVAGEVAVRVPRGSGAARFLLVWLYESYKSEAFACRRFDYRE